MQIKRKYTDFDFSSEIDSTTPILAISNYSDVDGLFYANASVDIWSVGLREAGIGARTFV